jgi:membrane protease YdiL (CAAX protease family)
MTALLVAAVALLVVVNVLNNRVLPWVYTRSCVVTAALLLVAGSVGGLSWAELGLTSRHLPRATAWSAVLVAAVAVAVAVLAGNARWRKVLYDDRAGRLSGRGLAFHALVRVPLGTVLLEEVAFRGVLYAAIAHDQGIVAGAVGSSLCFGLWHVLPSTALTSDNALGRSLLGTGPRARARGATVAVLATTLAGLALCWLRVRTDSLLTPPALHWATNALGLLGGWLVRSRFT